MNIKMNDFVGNSLQKTFTPAVTSCCRVHALNADAHPSAALLCYTFGNLLCVL